MENSEQLKSVLNFLRVRSSRPFFKKSHDILILIQNNNVLSRIWALFFYPLSLLWLLGCYIKYIGASKKPVKTVVVSIGNLETGGTGKTPTTIKVVKILKNFVSKTFIISYAKNRKSADESVVISGVLPEVEVLSGKNRHQILYEVLGKNPELVIVDDGFQYFEISNKINIVLVDPETSANLLIPSGRMRFPISFLKYADAIIVKNRNNNRNYPGFLNQIKKLNKPIYTLKYSPLHLINVQEEKLPLSFVENKKVLAFCGIAKPLDFIGTVEKLGPQAIYATWYPDHFQYCEKDTKELQEIFFRMNLDIAITTEKDLVKIKNLKVTIPLYGLVIETQIEPDQCFRKWLMEKFSNTKEELRRY
ncbi:MAG: tetraacyldisaccharide 4'-kinase [Candidatus Ratteibacteria bacterium]